MHLLFFLSIFLFTAEARHGYNYSGCGQGNYVADCLNKKEQERLAHERAVRVTGGYNPDGTPVKKGPDGLPVSDVTQTTNPVVERPMEEASQMEAEAQRRAAEKAAEAQRRADLARSIARFERAYAEQLATQYDKVRAYVDPRENSQNPQDRASAASRLRQPPELEERFQKTAQESGLRNNQDLRNKATDHVDKLFRDSEQMEKDAKRWDRDGEQGLLAAKQLGEFRDTLDQRTANMKSIGSGKLGGKDQDENAVNLARGAKNFTGRGSRNAGSSITSREELGLASGKAVSGVAKKTDAKNDITGTDGNELVGGVPGKKLSLSESLRDKLKRKLASVNAGGSGKDGAESGEKKSGYSQFFEEKGAGGSSAEAAAAGAGPDEAAAKQPDFFLSGPETDKVVAGFVGTVQSGAGELQGADAAVFGDASVSIFRRMTVVLRKCEQAKLVAR